MNKITEYSLKTLKNGLRVVFVPFKGARSVSLNLRGKAGSNYENETEIGTAHFLEHILLTGTKKYTSPSKIRSLITNVGGRIINTTSREDVLFIIKLLNEDLEFGFEYYSQILCHSNFENNYIERSKNVIIQEIKRSVDNPEKYIGRLAYKTLFPGQRFEKLNTGDLEDIKKINKKSLFSFYKSNYTGGNFVLAICGNLKKELVFTLAEKYLSDMPYGKENENIIHKKRDVLNILIEQRRGLNQAHIRIDFYGVEKDSQKIYASKYLARIFGEGKSSNLSKTLRDKKGLVYKLDAGTYSASSYGIFGIYTASEEENIPVVIKEVKLEIKKLMTKEISDKDFENIKKTLEADFIFDFEKISAKADFYSDIVLFKPKGSSFQTELSNLLNVTKKEILDLAKEIFGQNPKITILAKNIKKSDIINLWMNQNQTNL